MSDTTSNPNFPPGPYPPGQHIIPPPRPLSPATSGYRLNHLMLRITDPEKTLRFYNDCFGMHVIFIFNAGPWTIYYLGPRDVDIATTGAATGLLELYHIPSDTSLTSSYASGNSYSSPSSVGFGHIGFTVPDVSLALQRVVDFGYEIIKPLGEAEEKTMGVSSKVVSGQVGEVVEGYKKVFRQLAFVRDPDGYWVEIVPQVVV
ncbi:Glyoxalase/Bleomycin resistance protein/Dihydroxybiphenyl dioxygenase [Pleomassaria siparia CBS 279.74]|uniref:Glyoxalase/Bleomycin resistance protein/Dihydroxybiphenyl dioxygenase n=1 Tax=Pleomassaria siparia CBS 279.74 TaxID=1314801 RepID=A0A6G1JV43_9PLEO|nr:Glyoxalase/Bleomycin resistance protein/Dihydroxybiphenyl dioxygenase [Pleomassaria siparia CBS 279.74]